MDTLGKRIRARRRDVGISQGVIARALGITRESVSDWERDRTTPTSDKLATIARLLEVDVSWLMEVAGGQGKPGMARPPPRKPVDAPILFPGSSLVGSQDMPVYAAAMGGAGHLVVDFNVIEYVGRPEPLARVKDGYGILVNGESMVPAYRPGDIALVHPHLPPAHDEDVILYRIPPHTGAEFEAILKHLVSWDDRRWRLEQYQPPKQFHENRANWQVCHRVVGRYRRR